MIKHLSKSSIQTYKSCPFRFALTKIYGYEEPSNYILNRGVEMHDTLHRAIVLKESTLDYPDQVSFVKAVFNKFKNPEILVAEKHMEATYKDMKLVGYMDVVVKDGDRVIILDYKSGKDRGLTSKRFELALYAYILDQNNIKITHWGIIYTDQHRVYIEPCIPRELDKSVGIAYQTWEDIKNNQFDRKLSGCKWCGLRKSCDYLWEQRTNLSKE